jgi:hypothetical protein
MRRTLVAGWPALACAFAFSTSAWAAPATDGCALLTSAQASAALGGSVAAGKALTATVCQWEQSGKPGDELLKLDINIVTVERFNRTKSVSLGTITGAGGLGDEAYYATMKTGRTTLSTLNVKKGSAAVIIRVWGGTKPVEEYQAKEKAVAQAILPKL